MQSHSLSGRRSQTTAQWLKSQVTGRVGTRSSTAHHIGELGAQGAAVTELGFEVFQVLGDAGVAARHIAAGGADFLNPAQAVPVQGPGQIVAGRAGLRQRRFQAVEAGGHGQGGGLLRGARVAPQGFESQ